MAEPAEKKDSSLVVRQRALLQRLFGDEWERAADRIGEILARQEKRQGAGGGVLPSGE